MHRWILCLILFALPALAAEQFYRVSPADLKLLDGAKWPDSMQRPALTQGQVRVVMDGDAEAYSLGTWELNGEFTDPSEQILIRTTTDAKPTGTLIIQAEPRWPRRADDKRAPAAIVRFEVIAAPIATTEPTTAASREAALAHPRAPQGIRSQFYYAKAQHYTMLQRQGLPGAAWFGYQARLAEKELAPEERGRLSGMMRITSMWEHPEYDLFTGGRAVSENLQLDRPIQGAEGEQPAHEQTAAMTDVSSIPGIAVAEMDFTKLLGDARPQADALASLIPADQYAAFFPSITALFQMADQMKANAFPVIENLIPPSEDTSFLQRYQKQLGLEASELARLLGPNVVSSVAITGSDPLFPTGTDVAILFRSPSPQMLSPILLARIAASAGPGVKPQTVSADGFSYTVFATPDRTVSAYVVTLGDTVVVANSVVQLRAIAQARDKASGSLASSPEYRYFRSRYQLGDPSESVLLVIPDAAIRKWCSARWRIADARRIVARAKLLQARAEELASGKVQAAPPRDPVYGNLNFLTPISELAVDKVSPAEARAYTQWRDRYQQYWRGAFDPIALRMGFSQPAISADLTIMPLIASSEYRDMIAVTSGVSLQPNSGDPHDAILHFVMSINRDADPVRKVGSLGAEVGLPVDPLSWLGKSLAIYVDDDPMLKELASAENPEQYLQKHVTQLPVAVRVESSNPLKLAAFLTALRTKVDQTAPRLTTWQNLEASGLPYVKITSATRLGDDEGEELSICYAALPDSLVISPSEALIKRALARAASASAKAPVTKAAADARATTRPWLGANVAIQASSRVADLLHVMRAAGPNPVAEASWANIPILNEYHRLFPDQDPVALYERAWGARLVCPAGGKYVWNPQYLTMESTVTGCPDAPRKFATPDLVMNRFRFGNLGLSFENKGLRARMVLEMPPAPPEQANGTKAGQ